MRIETIKRVAWKILNLSYDKCEAFRWKHLYHNGRAHNSYVSITHSNSYSHTMMAEAAMGGANVLISSNEGFSYATLPPVQYVHC